MVTKQEQLEWLAKECDEWPVNGEYFTMNRYAIGACVHAHVITREEWKQERDKMQKQQDNSWHERGELPPVGCSVDVTGDDVAYGYGESDCEVLAHVEDCAVIRMSFGLGCFVAKVLSPSRTEREREIDEMAKLIGVECQPSPINICSKRAAEILYDAGYRKQ